MKSKWIVKDKEAVVGEGETAVPVPSKEEGLEVEIPMY